MGSPFYHLSTSIKVIKWQENVQNVADLVLNQKDIIGLVRDTILIPVFTVGIQGLAEKK